MENIFDLEEYSNIEDIPGISEESKSNSPKKDIIFKEESKRNSPQKDNSLPLLSNITSSTKQEINSEKKLINSKTLNDLLKNDFFEKSNNSNPSSNNKNNYNSEQIKTYKHKIYLNNLEKNEQNSFYDYAIEDKISISKFEEIKEPAMIFQFKLDDFQKRSIIRLEQNKSILVCAHTSSGKTLVAEYGIALGKKNNKKVIYTSPIKALSNQKYCEFKKIFKDVGIITGDVNINPNAQCLIITTEILHKFLYSQSQILNKVGTVIFDEVHYINDNERGHIWEEILIVLPNYISIIMLSATIPNYYEFACWVGKIKNTIVYVEITKIRVVPLQYFIYIDTEHIFKVKDQEESIDNIQIENAFNYLKIIKAPKNILNNNLNSNNKIDINEIKNENKNNNNIINIILDEHSNGSNGENEGNEINEDENNNEEENNEMSEDNYIKERPHKKNTKKKILEIVKYLLNNNLFPATLFVFNIRKITDYSSLLIKNNNLSELSIKEKNKINDFFGKAISSIPIQEQNISQINYIRKILQYGIGVHHSGLLPILKEIIEILYFHGLIKILFATTSFSIGLNMPTRTVVFTSLYKYHEGKSLMINSNEFLQMCGRAGRRGIDKCGNVYIIFTQPQGKNEIKKFKNILKGEGDDLESKFRLSYRIILSFYHRNLKNINDFFKESFHESHNIEIKPERLKEINSIKCQINKKLRIKCINYGKNKEKEDENFLNGYFIDIEDSPMAKLINNINKYDLINQKIYKNEKIIEYLNNNPGTILKIKISNNTTINKFHKSDLVVLIKIISLKNIKKLWCYTITSHEDNKNQNINKGNSNTDNKEDELNEKEKIYLSQLKNKGKYKEYNYKYVLINFADIIEIYEKPKVDLKSFYDKEKINNYFDIKEKGYYYFKNTDKGLYLALKYFYRAIINNFPKKSNDIQVKRYKNKKNNQFIELKTVKILDCLKIIGNKNENNNIYHEKKKLKEKIKKSFCEKCPHYPNHLCTYKEISEMKEKINSINNEILQGEKDETYKKFIKRLELLKELNYIQNDNFDNNENNNSINEKEEILINNYSLTLKGKASLEIISNDSILITELLLSNIFIHDDIVSSNEIIVSFLSSFVNNSKVRDLNTNINLEDIKNNEEIQNLMKKFRKIYNEIIGKELLYNLKESVYNRNFSFKYFNSVYTWILGNNFCDVCSKYEIVEGKLYTVIMRTFYFVEEIINFYKKIENEKLANTFQNIKNKLLKGIMSVESLYLKDDIDIDNI